MRTGMVLWPRQDTPDFAFLAVCAEPSRLLASSGFASVQLRPAGAAGFARPSPARLQQPSFWHPSGAPEGVPQLRRPDMTNNRNITIHTAIWQGITLDIRYEPSWLSTSEDDDAPWRSAHLEIRTINPVRASLPITETGYRSHFVHQDYIQRAGGPVEYVIAWLDSVAAEPWWRERVAASRQLSLF